MDAKPRPRRRGKGSTAPPVTGAPLEEIRSFVLSLGGREAALTPGEVSLQLAERADDAFTEDGWLFELKYDGFRALCGKLDGRPEIRLRSGADATDRFPELAAALAALPGQSFLLDGELVILDERGRPQFDALLERTRTNRSPLAACFAFDLLALEGVDLREAPLVARKQALRALLPAEGRIRYLDHIEREGEAFLREVLKQDLEGIIAKRMDSPYRGGRQDTWRKVTSTRTFDFVVVGRAREWGALHLAAYEGGTLRYAGRVGSGFGPTQVKLCRESMEAATLSAPPCIGEIPPDPERIWVRPEWVCEVRYKRWASDGAPRQPVFLRFREDKAPRECIRTGEDASPAPAPAPASPRAALSNPTKVYFPDDGLTKGELVAYYRGVARWLLPYLKDRPVMLTRYPDGIRGKHFYQQRALSGVPPWVRRMPPPPDAPDDGELLLCDSEEALAALINLGTIPLHLWTSRTVALDRPDWCILDLDPKTAPFAHVLTLAVALRGLCEALELPCFVKSTGSSGLHVLLPLNGQCSHAESITLAEVLAQVVQRAHPAISTLERSVPKRAGRVYIDCYQNGLGRHLVAPFSARPLPGAPVAMPLRWSEVGPSLGPRDFTVRNALARMEALGEDPLRPVLELTPNLVRALQRLQERVGD